MSECATKPPCRYPLPDGRRCCECDACQGTFAVQLDLDWTWCAGMLTMTWLAEQPLRFWKPTWAVPRVY